MRLLYAILLLLSAVLFWYLATNYCECAKEEQVERVVEKVAPLPMKKLSPIGFACSEATPSYDARWAAFKDSLVSTLQDNQILEIVGYSFSGESSGGTNLGAVRAEAVRSNFDLDDSKIKLSSQSRNEACKKENAFEKIRFRMLRNSTKIKEVGDKTLIYFPVNSTNKLADAEIESYLNDVAKRVKASGEKVNLTGHTDSTGNRDANIRLGQGRADVIKSYLMSQGVPASQLMSSSEGPDSPIADNATDQGRAQNRRTELQIIK